MTKTELDETGLPRYLAHQAAWERRWSADGETPAKVKNDAGRWVWPLKYKLLPVTKGQCLPDDVPLYALPDNAVAQRGAVGDPMEQPVRQHWRMNMDELIEKHEPLPDCDCSACAIFARDVAVEMLAQWCVAVDENGAGWDDWDEHYKDAMYRPGPLRERLDKAILEARNAR